MPSNHPLRRSSLALALAASPFAIGWTPQKPPSAELKPIPVKLGAKVPYYIPQRLSLTPEKPAGIKKEPAYESKPLYGTLTISGKRFFIALDEKEDDSAAKIYLDANGDGDLTNDATPKWERSSRPLTNPQTKETIENILFMGSGAVTPKKESMGLNFYRFGSAVAKMRNIPDNTLLYYRDFGRSGKMTFGDKTYDVILVDESASGAYDQVAHGERDPARVQLLVDRDGDGRFYGRHEMYDLSKPFNIGGVTYELGKVTPDGARLSLKVSKQDIAEIPVFSLGGPALAFSRPDLDGKTINFPADYKGKLVLLDFWATWCGPCIAELPNLLAAYDKYHERGFEILGISLDRENQSERVRKFLADKKMTWAQIYDGKYWEAEIAQKYGIQSIPSAFLVDGTSGKIIALGNSLRGEALDKTLETALAKMKTASAK